ncbi:DUF1294 domain-containing protein [Oceaniferula spumae]
MIKRRLTGFQKLCLGGLLILPTLALLHISIARIGSLIAVAVVFGVALLFSWIAYRSCASDKNKAQTKQWRTTEAHLHFLELIGGWPGSFIAQRRYRHKVAKQSYQAVFWMIIVIHQAVSADYLFDGPCSSFVLDTLTGYVKSSSLF